VECDVDGTEEVSYKVEEAIDIKDEVSIKVEEAIDIRDEIPEAIIFPPIKTEKEVKLWGACEVMSAQALGHLLPKINTSLFPGLCYIVGAIYVLRFGMQS